MLLLLNVTSTASAKQGKGGDDPKPAGDERSDNRGSGSNSGSGKDDDASGQDNSGSSNDSDDSDADHDSSNRGPGSKNSGPGNAESQVSNATATPNQAVVQATSAATPTAPAPTSTAVHEHNANQNSAAANKKGVHLEAPATISGEAGQPLYFFAILTGNDGQIVANAPVLLTSSHSGYIQSQTDSHGFALFTLPTTFPVGEHVLRITFPGADSWEPALAVTTLTILAPAATATPVPTATPTYSPTPLPTATATATDTPAPTATPTATDTATAIPTATPTATATATDSPTPLPTATATTTDTPTPTATPTATTTPTATDTATATATATDPPTPLPTATYTATATDSPTPLPTATPTATNTPMPTATATATATPLPTATDTATAIPTPTITATATESPTALPTATDTATPEPTATPTESPTPLPTATNTPAPTETTAATETLTTTTQSLVVALQNGASDASGLAAGASPTPTPPGVSRTAPVNAPQSPSLAAQPVQAPENSTPTANRGVAANTPGMLWVGLGGAIIGAGLCLLLLALVRKIRQINFLKLLKMFQSTSASPSRLRALILEHLWQMKGNLILAFVGILGATLTDILSPWPLKLIFDYVLLPKESSAALPSALPPALANALTFFDQWLGYNHIGLLIALAAAYGLIALMGNGFAFLESYLTSRIGFQLVSTLRRELFVQLQRLSLSFHTQSRRGELLNKVSSDTQALREAFAESGLALVTNCLTLIGMCIIMLLVNWRLSLIPLLTMPALLYIYHRMQDKVTETARTQRKAEGEIAAQVSENLAIIPVIQAFGRERDEVRRFDTANSQNLDKGVHLARLNAAMSRTIGAISAVGVLGVIFYGAWLALNAQMSPGDVLLFVTYVKGMYKPIRDVVKLSGKLTKAAVSAQRIDEILSMEPEIQDKPEAVVARQLRGEITFSHVKFGYDHTKPILHDVSFQIAPGQRVALVGSSGAGKSTIANLLLRLYEAQEGTITLDGLNIRDYERESVRRQIGLVLQEAFLMNSTLRENIAYGKPNATEAEIETAARQAHIHDFIISLPNGYETVIGELGNTLSGGQRQRIAIARALVKQPSILILDEPTSALDAESRVQVQETIDRLQRGKTVLCIAHQLSTVQNFDQIIVMDKGRVVEQGTHQELLAQRSVYAKLYRLQHATSASETNTETTAKPPIFGYLPGEPLLQPG